MKQSLNEVKRMQQLAGILNESQIQENEYRLLNTKELAELIAKEHGDELRQITNSVQRQNKALDIAHDIISGLNIPKASIIATNLTGGYADEDWPWEFIHALYSILKGDNTNPQENETTP